LQFIKCRPRMNGSQFDILLNLSRVKSIEELVGTKEYLLLKDVDDVSYTCRKDPDTQFGITGCIVKIGD